MDVTLKPELERFLREQVTAGRYASFAEAINSAVAQLQADRAFSTAGLDALRAEIDVGLKQADRGEFVDFNVEDVIRERRAAWSSEKAKSK